MRKEAKTALAASFMVLLVSVAYVLLQQQEEREITERNVMGIPVYSRISIEEFQNKTAVALLTNAGKAETTCNFELAAVSTEDRRGYVVHLERSRLGVYLDRKDAYIRGETDDELLSACHAFVCLREGIDCQKEILNAKNITLKNTEMIIAIDNRSGSQAVMGFVELQGALGFLQAQLADTNGDGAVSQAEANENDIYIFPYIMEGDRCVLQPFRNTLQQLNITNNTASCEFMSGIYLRPSKTNKIEIDGRKIIISGDDEHIRTGAIIIRDLLSPEWIRFYYGMT